MPTRPDRRVTLLRELTRAAVAAYVDAQDTNYYSDNIVQYIHTIYYYYSTQSNELNAIALTVVEDIPRSLLQ